MKQPANQLEIEAILNKITKSITIAALLLMPTGIIHLCVCGGGGSMGGNFKYLNRNLESEIPTQMRKSC